MEVLVALGILIALAGLALPSLTNWSSRYSDETFADELQSALDSARAIALELGEPVSVGVVNRAQGGQTVLASWERAASGGDEEAATSRRVLLVVGEGFRIEEAGEENTAKTPAVAEDRRVETTDEMLVLWSVLPDGTVRGRADARVVSADGRRGAVTVSGWGGVVSMAKLELPREDAPAPGEDGGAEEKGAPVVNEPKEEPS